LEQQILSVFGEILVMKEMPVLHHIISVHVFPVACFIKIVGHTHLFLCLIQCIQW